jgi:competence protein ComFC
MGGLTHPLCRNRYTIDGTFSSLVYKGVVKKLVYTFKYSPYLTALQPQLTDLFYEGLIQKEQFYKLLQEPSLFVPIPIHKNKYKKRGYNQSVLLADGLAKRFDIAVLDCMQRTRETKTQIGLSKEQRQENIKNAFAIKDTYKEHILTYSHVLLVDDVVTSGATLREAANTLKRAGVKHVWGVTLAHGE